MPNGHQATAPSAGGPTQHTPNQADPLLTAPQLRLLHRPVDPKRVGKDDKGFAHMEAWDIRRYLLRVFGFAGFDIENRELALVREIETPNGNRSKWTVVYRAQVRLTVKDVQGRVLGHWDGEAAGAGNNLPSLADSHDMALKTATSQALKRAAVNLGDVFGLSLYNDGSRDAVVQFSAAHPPEQWKKVEAQVPEPDDPPVQPEQQPTPAEETPTEPDPLEAFKPKVTNGWNNLDATRQNLLEARAKGLTDRVVPAGADGTPTRIGELLEARIAELETAREQRSAA